MSTTPPDDTSSFASTKHLFSADDLEAIHRALDSWALTEDGSKIVPNIREKERFLPAKCMESMLRVIGAALPHDDIPGHYQVECFKHGRCGGGIDGDPTFVGRAVERKDLRTYLLTSDPWKRIFLNNDDLVEKFLSRLFLFDLEPDEQALPMTAHTAWVTWDHRDSTSNPFGFATTADEIRDALGLRPRDVGRGKSMALLVYRAPGRLFRPTVADAELNPRFEPPPPDENRFGLARPLTPGSAPRRPEAVHAPASFMLLDSSFTRITA